MDVVDEVIEKDKREFYKNPCKNLNFLQNDKKITFHKINFFRFFFKAFNQFNFKNFFVNFKKSFKSFKPLNF